MRDELVRMAWVRQNPTSLRIIYPRQLLLRVLRLTGDALAQSRTKRGILPSEILVYCEDLAQNNPNAPVKGGSRRGL